MRRNSEEGGIFDLNTYTISWELSVKCVDQEEENIEYKKSILAQHKSERMTWD